MHAFPADDNEDALSVTAIYLKERDLSAPPPGFDEHLLFEFLIEGCLLTRTTGHGDPAPVHTVWKASAAPNQRA
jgi:hypothetical protein